MRLKLTLLVASLIATAYPQTSLAQGKDFFFVGSWSSYCKPSMERIAAKREQSGDGEKNGECLAYVMGAIDTLWLNLMLMKHPCSSKPAKRDEFFVSALVEIEKFTETEKAKTPTAAVLSRIIAKYCGV